MNQVEKKQNDYIYIFNRKQAILFIRNGGSICEEDINVNRKSGNICFRFRNDEKLKELFKRWCNRDLA